MARRTGCREIAERIVTARKRMAAAPGMPAAARAPNTFLEAWVFRSISPDLWLCLLL
jgi:hypothetical protein